MKKSLIMLVLLVISVCINAQIIYKKTVDEITLNNGYVYRCADIPGYTWMQIGDNMSTGISNYFSRLRTSDPERYQREYNKYVMYPPQPIRTVAINGVGMGMVGGVGMVGMGVGMGMQNTGMVMGAGGMAGATSSVHIDNSNMVSTIGSGINVNYDSGTNSLYVSGDPLMAVGRVVAGIAGAKKAKKAQNTTTQVVYVDAATGQIIGQQTGQYVQQPVQTNGQVVYNAQTGQYVRVQQSQPVQNGQVRVQSQPVQQVRVQTQPVQNGQTNTGSVMVDLTEGW